MRSILWRLYASVIAAVLTPDPARKTKPTNRRKLWQVHNFCALWRQHDSGHAIDVYCQRSPGSQEQGESSKPWQPDPGPAPHPN
jgi:hypothetical protein